MLVDVRVSTMTEIDIEADEAFRVLCKTLDMNCVLDEVTDYRIMEDSYGENRVHIFYHDGSHDIRPYDDRGDLFIALRNVAVQMFPNVRFRNADYIYKNKG